MEAAQRDGSGLREYAPKPDHLNLILKTLMEGWEERTHPFKLPSDLYRVL